MAASGFVIKEPTVSINGDDVSDFVREVHVNREYADVDATGGRGDGAMEHKAGLRADSFVIVAKSAYGASELDATLESLFEAETEFEVEVSPFNTTISDSNPNYVGTVLLLTYSPFGGAIGELATTGLTMPCQGRIVRETT